MKLTIGEIKSMIACLQIVLDEADFITDGTRENLASAIFKLRHQLKHLEDLEVKQK